MKEVLIDADELDRGLRTPFYAAVAFKLVVMLTQKMEGLVQMADAEKTAHTRGYIEGIRAAQRIPELLKSEIEARRGRKGVTRGRARATERDD